MIRIGKSRVTLPGLDRESWWSWPGWRSSGGRGQLWGRCRRVTVLITVTIMMVQFMGKSPTTHHPPSRWRVGRAGPGRDSLAGCGHQPEIWDSDKHDWYNADSDSQSDCRPSPSRIRYQESYSLSKSESELVTQWLGLRRPSLRLVRHDYAERSTFQPSEGWYPSLIQPCSGYSPLSGLNFGVFNRPKKKFNSTPVISFKPIGQAAAWQQCIQVWAPASHLAEDNQRFWLQNQ